ncbi:hypothetical protein GOD90_20365 [Sinorhizobium medicae]|nr:hypothetical protein [Sinorhizobium medicae]MDX0899309.1 hypothetical protein [Sinorhizobium medicae]MDX1120210.1 hypothetical protein [Sinorhizobium medicae]MDX1242692.1 hypothetical protein [Sinorhizobium medicae]
MSELKVSFKHEAAQAGAADVALPLRVLDADGGVVATGAASLSQPMRCDIGSASRPLFVRLTWPSGKTETKRADGPEVVFDHSSISRDQWAAWAVPRLNERTSQAVSASVPGQVAIDSYDRAWLRLWTFRKGQWSDRPLAPEDQNRNDSAIQLDFILDEHPWCLQLGGKSIPWMIISLPPGGRCRVLITPNESTDPRREPLKVVVTGFRSETETLLEFLSRDSLRAANAVASYVPLAIQLLEGKFQDPIAAVAGAYYLLRIDKWRQIELGWIENLDLEFPWIPDGAIIRAAVLTRGGLRDETAAKTVLERLSESLKRGVPIFAEGISLMHEAASVLRSGAKKTGFFKKVDRLAASRLWAGAAFAFSGEDPAHPSPERRRGTPSKVQLRRGVKASLIAGGELGASMILLQDVAKD